MTLVYADTSALATAYLPDESEHVRFRELLLEGPDEVVTSALTRVELASTIARSVAARRMRAAQRILAQFDVDCEDGGPVTLLALAAETILARAYEVVLEQRVRTLDAIHLAVALDACDDEPELVFVTRDARQAGAARALGLPVG